MNCKLCDQKDVQADHNFSQIHLKNKVLHTYLINKKQLSLNREGILVSCSAKSTSTSIPNCTLPKIEISIKPNDEVEFNFTISNFGRSDVFVIFIQMLHSLLDFSINTHGMGVGCVPHRIKPNTTLQKDVSIKYKSPTVGQYEMPILFCFLKNDLTERVVIVREMVVYVEENELIHSDILTPYAKSKVAAKRLYKSEMVDQSADIFHAPKHFKQIFACNLSLDENAPQIYRDIASKIEDTFDRGATKENYVNFFHNLLWYEETVIRIYLKNYNMSGVPLYKIKEGCILHVPGLAEKRPSLIPGDILFIKPHTTDEEMFEAVIKQVSDNDVIVDGMHQEFFKYYSASASFDIRFFMSRLSLERMHKAVHSVLEQGQESRIFPQPTKKIKQIKPINDFYNHLVVNNKEQRTAVEHIIAGTSGVAPFLLHGPPGTGKTATIVEAILQLVNTKPANRIMVCTDSNMAADHVASVILQYKHMFSYQNMMLRANSKFRVWETLPKCLEKYSNGTNQNDYRPVTMDEFISYRIVITTLSHAAKFAKSIRLKMLKRHITHLFIDEAAQACEPACLIPICGLLTPRGTLVLAGDPLQLGPVVISHNVRKLGLGVSLMERLMTTFQIYRNEPNDLEYIVMLRRNFRSDRDILNIPNNIFYKNQLVALAKTDELSRIDILGERKKNRAIVFHGVLSEEQRMGKSPSYFNKMELEIVQKYITHLLSKHLVKQEDIGVVSPYMRQVYHIKTWLREKNYDKIEVGTVEAFQGKEKRVIVISTVRANCGLLDYDAKFQLGFLVDDKRFNVALTRAKAKAIVIGNPLCLEKDAKWRLYMQECRNLGTYYGIDSEDIHKEAAEQQILPVIKNLLSGKVSKKI